MKIVAAEKSMYPLPITEIKNMVTNLYENKKGYTQHQFDQSKRSRKLYHNLGCPTFENFNKLLRQNTINKCTIITEDINISGLFLDLIWVHYVRVSYSGSQTRNSLERILNDIPFVNISRYFSHS